MEIIKPQHNYNDYNTIHDMFRKRQFEITLLKHNISKETYTNLVSSVIFLLATKLKHCILYGTSAYCLHMNYLKNEEKYNVCNLVDTNVTDSDFDIYVSGFHYDDAVNLITQELKKHKISFIGLNKNNNTRYSMFTVYTLYINGYSFIDLNVIKSRTYNSVEPISKNINGVKTESPLTVFGVAAKILCLQLHPKWEKNYKKYVQLFDEQLKEIMKRQKDFVYQKIDNDLIPSNIGIECAPYQIKDNIYTVFCKPLYTKIIGNNYLRLFVDGNDFYIYEKNKEYENNIFNIASRSQYTEYLLSISLQFYDVYTKTNNKYTNHLHNFISLLFNDYKPTKPTIENIKYNMMKEFTPLSYEMDVLLYVNEYANNFLHWGYGVEYETELHIENTYDLSNMQIYSKHANHNAFYGKIYNDFVFYYISTNKLLVERNININKTYYLLKLIYEISETLNNVIKESFENGSDKYHSMVGKVIRRMKKMYGTNNVNNNNNNNNNNIQLNNAENIANYIIDDDCRNLLQYINNITKYDEFANMIQLIEKLMSCIKSSKLTGEISNYIGEECSHGDVAEGENCMVEFVTQNHKNATVDACIEELQDSTNALLNVFKLFTPGCYFPKSCAEPFLLYNHKGYYYTKYNKSGSYHINITLPINTTNYNSSIHLKKYVKNIHLRYARILQFLSPLLIVNYGTPDFRAILKEYYQTDEQFTKTSYRLLSGGYFSPLPLISNLDSFDDERTTAISEEKRRVCWYFKIEEKMGMYTMRKDQLGIDFRSDPDKGANQPFGFEFRVMDTFELVHLKPLLYFITFIADLSEIIFQNLHNLTDYNSVLTHFYTVYGVLRVPLAMDEEFNNFMADLIMSGQDTEMDPNIVEKYKVLFFDIPTKLKLSNHKLDTENLNIIKLLEQIHFNMYTICENNEELCYYTQTMTNFYKSPQKYEKLVCINSIVIDEYHQIINNVE